MNTNHEALVELSQQLTAQLTVALAHVLACDIALVEAEDVWNNVYYDWCANVEGTMETPGGGRWNDSKRRFAVAELYPDLVETLNTDRKKLKGAETTLKLVNAEISGLNRVIRLLELASSEATPSPKPD